MQAQQHDMIPMICMIKGSRLPHGTCAVSVFFLDGNFHDFIKGLPAPGPFMPRSARHGERELLQT
jgi:hypothetical protein